MNDMLDIHRAHFMIDGSKLKLMSHSDFFFNFENLQQNVMLGQQSESGWVNIIYVVQHRGEIMSVWISGKLNYSSDLNDTWSKNLVFG